jgi:transposase
MRLPTSTGLSPAQLDRRQAARAKIIDSFPSCPIPEIARLGWTLKRWRTALLAYSETVGASNGGTEAINGLIELHRRIAPRLQKPGATTGYACSSSVEA